ncbi:calcium-binding protein CML45 [Tripterygium wilfordii]|uniref:Calcium-binding protein CML45 n=1 Tax=Tripterygium wilfordii TaxID=458696 RepID=A0A7J7DGE4_TRIWF|nr:probable calcium-binding protein CML45 [Tripterygium wilfordii]KAF5745455.1 calcium-binding protein CML45 [Tripterygium wilfordii]
MNDLYRTIVLPPLFPYLSLSSMEKILALNNANNWLLLCLENIFLDIRIFFQLLLRPLLAFFYNSSKADELPCSDESTAERLIKLSQSEIKMVMDRLGLTYDDTVAAEERRLDLGEDELSKLFDEEPSLEELKEAFDVFDENKDGYIDGTDLNRVLHCLGLESKVGTCGDRGIHFNEFVSLMHKCFC